MKGLHILKKGTITLLAAWLSLPNISFALQNLGTTQAKQGIAYPEPNYGTGAQRALIEKGEYLAKAGNCIACHTDTTHNAIPFAGGLGINTSFGTFYTPNITPDKATGIGNWTDAQFFKAMQHGVMPNGSYYLPIFPYPNFTKINRDDLLAIKAYLFSLKPTHQVPPKNDAPFPFSWRFLQLGWRILFFHSGEYINDDTKSPAWNRGAYLVQGLEHCGMCHTPVNLLGAPKNKYFLRGGIVDNYYAPDITGDALKSYPVEQIIEVFTKNKLLTGKPIKGPMAEVNNDSLKYLSQDDLRAIAIYLKTVKSKALSKDSDNIATARGTDTGKKIYIQYCAACHDAGAANAPKIGDQAAWTPRIKKSMGVVFQHAINGIGSMPAKGTCVTCSDAEVRAAVEYMVQQSTAKR